MAAYRSTPENRVLDHRDFAPRRLEQRLIREDTFEPLSEAVSAASDWIRNHDVDVVNIETVALPNIWDEDGTQDPSLKSHGEGASRWYQFVRVWFWRSPTG